MAEFANRRVLALVGLVLVSVAAISMSAATLTSAQGVADSGTVQPDYIEVQSNGSTGPQDGNRSQQNLYAANDSSSQTLQLSGCNDFLASTPGSLVFFAALAGVLYGLKRRFSLGMFIFGGYAITPVALAFYFLRTDCTTAGGGGPDQNTGGGIAGVLGQQTPGPSIPAEYMLGIFALLFVGVAAAVYFTSNDEEYATAEDEEVTSEDADVTDIAEAAADAAERLESRNADVNNEVYRAWLEMTQLLDVASPGTHTPGEFADAAVELGVDREHVDPLTTLFEEVRYGHRDPESREEQAIEVFRAIEVEYGTESGADAQTSDTDDANDTGTTANDGNGGDDA